MYPSLTKVYEYCIEKDIPIPYDLHKDLLSLGIKTEQHYTRVMWRAVRDLYNKDLTQFEFEDVMIKLIEGQLRKAWYAGMREVGLTPEDMTPEFEAELQEIMLSEFDYVPGLAQNIRDARDNDLPIDPFKQRVELWVSRFKDVTNRAKLFTAKDGVRFKWVYGDTDHCTECEKLDGIVATAQEWQTSGIRPQSPPNPYLSCSGFRCQCSLEMTSQRRSPDALDTLMTIALSKKSIKAERWVTIRGRHVLIDDDGRIIDDKIRAEIEGEEAEEKKPKEDEIASERAGIYKINNAEEIYNKYPMFVVGYRGDVKGQIYGITHRDFEHYQITMNVGLDIDDFVRFTSSRQNKSITVSMLYSALTGDINSDEYQTKGMKMIESALDSLFESGLDKNTEVTIMNGRGEIITTTVKTYGLGKDE